MSKLALPLFSFLLLAVSPCYPQAKIDLGTQGWVQDSKDKSDSQFEANGGVLTLRRAKAGYYLRCSRDVEVRPDTKYRFTCFAALSGAGTTRGTVFFKSTTGAWDEKNVARIDGLSGTLGKDCAATFVTPPDCVAIRVSFVLEGAPASLDLQRLFLEEIVTRKGTRVPLAKGAPVLDGRLDESFWAQAVRLGEFRILGAPQQKARLSTEVFLAVSGGALWVGWRAEEPEPDRIVARVRENQLWVTADDDLEAFLSIDQVAVCQFAVNSLGFHAGIKRHYTRERSVWFPGGVERELSGYQAKAERGQKAWTAEMRIPLDEVLERPPVGDLTLFVNFARHRNAGDEPYANWAGLSGKSFHAPAEFFPVAFHFGGASETAAGDGARASQPFTQRLGTPDLLLAGKPVKWIDQGGRLAFPVSCRVVERGAALEAGLRDQLCGFLSGGPGSPLTVVLERTPEPFSGVSLTAAERAHLDGNSEAFRLTWDGAGARILAKEQTGLLRGVATLALMGKRARTLPGWNAGAFTLVDAPRMARRGWMPYRGDRIASLREEIDLAFLLRMNFVLLTMDGAWTPGNLCPFPFQSHPDLGNPAIPLQAWKDLFAYARARGVEPVPYFASWERSQFITRKPGYGSHAVKSSIPMGTRKGFANLDVFQPETRALVFSLQGEIIDALKPASFHIGFDEKAFGDLISDAARAAGKKPSDAVVEQLTQNADFLRKRGVRLFCWGDMLDPSFNGTFLDQSGPALLARLPKDVVIFDWRYEGQWDRMKEYPSLKLFRDAGFEVVGAPWYFPPNLTHMVESVVRFGAQGACMTAWIDTDAGKIPPELMRGLALSGYQMWSADDPDPARIPFVPDALFKTIALQDPADRGAEKPESLAAPAGLLAGEAETARALAFREGVRLDFLLAPFTNHRGVAPKPFQKDGSVAAVLQAGNEAPEVVGGEFDSLDAWTVEGARTGNATVEVEGGALKVSRRDGASPIRVYQDIKAVAGKMHRLKFRARTAHGQTKVFIHLGEVGPRGVVWNDLSVALPALQGETWQTASFPFECSEKQTRMRVNFSVEGAAASAWYDDVEVVAEGTAPAAAAKILPVGRRAKRLTFLHAVGRQPIAEDMSMMAIARRYEGATAGKYRIVYEDGSAMALPLRYRVQIGDFNDPALGREMEIGLFGTLGNRAFVNAPTYTWVNPHPERTIRAIEVKGGNRKDLNLALFGVTVESP
ncbi:MAG: hypothetical protein J0L75_08405 [Spirochaetes bacterium]|nr:hypothetical protein [Spirochaetota bacterium]